MAGKNEIKHRLSLEGDDEVKSKLKAVGEAGKQSLGEIEKSFSNAHGAASEAAEGIGGAAGKLKEALDPILEEAGLSRLGGIFEGGLIGRLLGAAGPAGAFAALSGLALHMAKVSEETDRTDKRLKALGGGKKALDDLEESAKKLGTSPETLEGGFEDFLGARRRAIVEDDAKHGIIHPPGYVPPDGQGTLPRVVGNGRETVSPVANDEFLKAQRTLREGASVEHADTAKASQAINQLLSSLYQKHEGGKTGLTSDAVRDFSKALPDDANRLARAVGNYGNVGRGFGDSAELAAFLDRSGPLDPKRVLSSLAKEEPNAQKDAEAARGVSDAFERLKASAGQLDKAFSEISGKSFGKGITEALDKVSSAIEKEAERIHKNKEAEEKGEGVPKSWSDVLNGKDGDLMGRLVGFLRAGGGTPEKNPFGQITDFVKTAATNPGALKEPEKQPGEATGPLSPITAPLASNPVITGLQQRMLELDRLRDARDQRNAPVDLGLDAKKAPVTPSQPPQDTNPAYSWPLAPGSQQPPPPQQPAPEPTVDQLLQQRAAAAPAPQPPSIVSEIAGALQGLVEKLAPPANNKLEGTDASNGLGLRGDAGPLDNGEAPQNVAALDGAAGEAAEGLRQVASAAPAAADNLSKGNDSSASTTTVSAKDGGLIRSFDEGGAVRGPGTSTSDDIPARLSDGEYVVNARETGRNRGTLDAINNGTFAKAMSRMFADGGAADKEDTKETKESPRLKSGDHEVTYDPSTGGAFVDGVLHMPGDPLLDDPAVKRGIEQSKAGMRDQGSKHERYHSPFVGRFGHDDSNGAEDTYVAGGGYLAGAGKVQHFARGGNVWWKKYYPHAWDMLFGSQQPIKEDGTESTMTPQQAAEYDEDASGVVRGRGRSVYAAPDEDRDDDTNAARGGFIADAGKVQRFAKGGNVWWKKYYPHSWDMLFGSQRAMPEDGTESTMTRQQGAQYDEDVSGVVQGRGQPTYHAPDEQDDDDTNAARGGFLAGARDVRRYASGDGPISGPGTTTSDDIPAMLSHGEFVVNARETAKNRDLLHAINDGTLHKALGGMIEVPGFADGGGVGQVPGVTAPGLAPSAGDISSSPMEAGHHAIDMRTNFGDFRVLAPEHIARSMSAAARDSANAQTGQRPSWYKGR